VNNDDLFGAHSVVCAESANNMRQLLKRARESDSDDD
jgi:hypothetical protein